MPTYSIATSASRLDEGGLLTTTVSTTGVLAGTPLYWSLDGDGITEKDFFAGLLSGTGIINSAGNFSFSHTLAKDLTTEGLETIRIRLYSDEAHSLPIGAEATVSISDTSIKNWSTTSKLDPSAIIEPKRQLGSIAHEAINYLGGFNGTTYTKALSYYIDPDLGEDSTQFALEAIGRVDNLLDIDFKRVYSKQDATFYFHHKFFVGKDNNGQKGLTTWQAKSIPGTWNESAGRFDDVYSFSADIALEASSWNVQLTSFPSITDFTANTILHEFGHALGLSHPNGNPDDPAYSNTDTVESYNFKTTGSGTPFYTAVDLIALRQLWGDELHPTDCTVSATTDSCEEGDSFEFAIWAPKIASGSELYWSASGNGISGDDFESGEVQGRCIVGTDGRSVISLKTRVDSIAEGSESLTISLYSDESHSLFLAASDPVAIADAAAGRNSDYISVTAEAKQLSGINVSKPLSEQSLDFLSRYKVKKPDGTVTSNAAASDTRCIEFSVTPKSTGRQIAQISLPEEVRATGYIRINPLTGESSDYTFNPSTGLGTELLDKDKNGLVDTLRIHLGNEINNSPGSPSLDSLHEIGTLAEAPRRPIYRFYRNGVHFYTSEDSERDSVIHHSYGDSVSYNKEGDSTTSPDLITGGWGYRYEGIAYQALSTQGTSLYRFFSPSKGYHFVTTNAAEALNVVRNSVGSTFDLSNAQGQRLLDNGWGYQFEGNSFNVSTIAQMGMDQPVYRFFNAKKGVHFYSSSLVEAKSVIENSLGAQYVTGANQDWIIATANALRQNPLTPMPTPLASGWGYSFEGIAWYV